MKRSLWCLTQNEYDANNNRKYETLFTLSNGYRGLRGNMPFSNIGTPGNFIAGIFDKNNAQVTEIVNCPNPLAINIYIEDEKIDIDRCKLMKFNRSLNMKEGILTTDIRLITAKGKILNLYSERFVSRNNVHRWAEKYVITPINFSGKVFIENIIDGTIINSSNDPTNAAKHFKVENLRDMNFGIELKAKTLDKGIEITEQSIIKMEESNKLRERKYDEFGERVRELYETTVINDESLSFYRLGCTYTSREDMENINKFFMDGYEKELIEHKKVWKSIWDKIIITIEGDDKAQNGIIFNLFHLSSSAYNGDERVSIAAKALHGEGYKGHVFWDTETFMLPFFIYTCPDIAKSLLMYRYNTLPGARKNARLNGYKGAQFPWESADDGLEVTPKWGFDYDGNPVRIWTGDEEYHINSDISFAIWEYYRATKDKEFLINYGAELFFDTAKFWESRVEYNKEKHRYEINKVIGPDEFHEHVNNNVYTNYLAKWSISKTIEIISWLKKENRLAYEKLCIKLGLEEKNFEKWKDIEEKIYIPKSKDGKLIEQFEGYFDLCDIPITEYDENEMPVWPELKGLKLGDTQLIKQADVVMLMLMLREEFDPKVIKENYKFYEKRTMHKSSLSPSMYSIMGLSVNDNKNSYKYFIKALMTDIDDNQGNTDFGIHAASTGGAWQSAIFGFGGLSVDKEQNLNLSPWIPKEWESMSFKINWRGANLEIKATKDEVELSSSKEIEIKVYGEKYKIGNQKAYIKALGENYGK